MDVFRSVFKHQQEQEDIEEQQYQQQQQRAAYRNPNNNNGPLPQQQQQQQQLPPSADPTPTPSNNNKPTFSMTSTKNNVPPPAPPIPPQGKPIPKLDLSSTAKPSAVPANNNNNNAKVDPAFGQRLDSPPRSSAYDPSTRSSAAPKVSTTSVPPPPPPAPAPSKERERQVEFSNQPTNVIERSRNPSTANAPAPQLPKQEEKGFFGKLFSGNKSNHEQPQQQQQQQGAAISPRQNHLQTDGYTNPPLSARSEAHSLFDQGPAVSYQQRPNGLQMNAMVSSANRNISETASNAGTRGHTRSLSTQGIPIPEQVMVNSPQNGNRLGSKGNNNTNNNNTNQSFAASTILNGNYPVDHIPIVAQPFIPATNAALRAQRATVSVGFTGACTGCLVWMEERSWVVTSIDAVFDGGLGEYLKLMQLAIRSPCIPKHFIPEALFVCDTPEEHHGGVALLRFSDLYSHLLRPLCVFLSEKVCALHTDLLGYQIEVPPSRRIFDEDHIFGGSALSAVVVTVVQTRSEFVWRALPDLARSVNAITGAPIFDEIGDIVAIVVGTGAMLSATSCRTRWDFERHTLSHEADREFLKKDYQFSRLRLGAFVAQNHAAASANALLDSQNQILVGGGLDFDDVVIATLETARALDELFKSITPGGALATRAGGDGSRNKRVEVVKPGSTPSGQHHADLFTSSPSRTGGLSKNKTAGLSRQGAAGTMGRGSSPTKAAARNAQQQEESARRKRVEELELLDPADDLVAQDNMFRLINQPSNGAMALAATLPRLVRMGTLPTSWCLVHAMMACERRYEVSAGSVRMMQSHK